MFRKQIFTNGIANKDEREFAIFATPNGFLVTPTAMRTAKKLIINYDIFYEDIFLTDEESILKKINEQVLAQMETKRPIGLLWASDVTEEFNRIKLANYLVNKEFDRE